jgi:transposase
MSVKEAACIVGLDWKTVKDIDKANIRSSLKGLSMEQPVRIGVDEVAYQKGHKYLTVVRDVDEGRVLWVGLDRKKETLDRFFEELGAEKSRRVLMAVMDMWNPLRCQRPTTYGRRHYLRQVPHRQKGERSPGQCKET